MTATANPVPARVPDAPPPAGSAVVLDASATTACRRRIHLDHDPSAVAGPRALPDPALAQRREDAAEHRAHIGAVLAAAAPVRWHAVARESPDRVAATAAAVAAEAPLIWGAVLPDAVLPDAVLPDAVLPDAVLPDAVLPDAVLPDAVLPDAVLPDAVLPDAVLPDAVLPDAVLPDAVLPDAVLPDPVLPDPVLPDAVLPDAVLPDPGVSSPRDARADGPAPAGAAPGLGRRGGAELLVRLPGGGYVPVVVVRHRVSDPGAGALTTPLPEVDPRAADTDPDRKPRSQPRDLLRLAHLHRMLDAAGWAPAAADPFRHHGGVIGMDADVVVWHDLRAGHWPGGRSTLAEYDARLADRLAVAAAAATGAPALARPSRITECRRCPWWPTCEAELEREQDVSLVVRGDAATALRAAGVTTVARLAGLDPTAEPPAVVSGSPFPDLVALARAWQRGLAVVRRVPVVPVLRADVEVDVDMESFGEAGAYLWGALLSYRAGARPGDEPEGYRGFATWEPVPTRDEARSFAAFWGWLSGMRERAAATGRSFAAYCYNEQAENRWLLASARRFAGLPGVPTLAQVEAFIADPCWVDLFAVVGEWFLCAHGKGLKRIAPAAGFAWRDPEAGGENSMRWYRDAVGMDGAARDPEQRRRLLEYNADDVAATHTLRQWMTSPAILEVPLAGDL